MPHDKTTDNPPRLEDLAWTPELYCTMQRYLHEAHPCVLCGKRGHYNAVFLTRHGEPYGGKPGKIRLIGYGLCRPMLQAA